MLTVLLIIIAAAFGGLFGYSLWVLKTLRQQIKDQKRALDQLRSYKGAGEWRLP